MNIVPVLGVLALGASAPWDEVPRATGHVVDHRKNFCELSLGWADGAWEGAIVDIYSGRTYIDSAIIRRAQRGRSIAEIIPGTRKGEVRIGNEVRLRGLWYDD